MRITYERPSTLAKRMGGWITKTAARYAAVFVLTSLVIPILSGVLVTFGKHETLKVKHSQTVALFQPTYHEPVSVAIFEAQAETPVIQTDGNPVFAKGENKILAELAKCESGSVKEPEAALVWDTNLQHAIGKYQWQIPSLKHYIKKLYGQTITNQRAIIIAIDADTEIDVDDLTRKVIFEDTGVHKDWVNCTNKYGLKDKVELLNSLQ